MTTTGAQLFEPISNKLNLDGITITFDENGEKIVVSGTPESSQEFQISKPIQMQAGEKYVLTLDEVHYFENIWLQSSSGISFGWSGKNTTNMVIITVPDSITERTDCVMYASVLNGEAYNFTMNHLMLNAGEIPLPWEPYTGGKPSPSPDYPQEIVSAGDDGNLSVIVKNPDNEQMQSVSFSTPNGLPGIPVTYGGNYTDENGQQWICDEVDLGRGVYVQRIASFMINAKNANDIFVTNLYTHVTVAVNARIRTPEETINSLETRQNRNLFCEALPWTADEWSSTVNSMGFVENGTVDFTVENSYLGLSEASTNDERKAALVKYFTDKPCQIIYRIATPIETPLTTAEISAYKSLRTYRGTTIVEAEDKAGISVKYNMPMPKLSKNGALRRWFKRHPII